MLRYIIALLSILIVVYFSTKEDSFDDKVLKLGVSIPKSGIMKAWGDAVYSGANAYLSYVNENDLLPGKKIKLITYDDKYEPDLTAQNVKKLIGEEIFSFFGFVGTPTVKNILPLLEKNTIPFIAPFTGASFLREPQQEHFINFRSSYKEEIDSIVTYLYEKKQIRRFAVFYQNDDYGEEGFISFLSSLDRYGLKVIGEGTYKRNTLSIQHAFHEIKSVQPEVVLMIGAYKANALFIKTAKKDAAFKKTIFCNISFGNANEMIKELDYKTDNLLFSEVVPSYKDTSIPIVLEYQMLMKKYFPNQALGFISLESFLAAKTVIEALKNIQGDVTREIFINKIKHLSKDSLEGIVIDFKNHQLHNKTYLFEYQNSKFIEVNQ